MGIVIVIVCVGTGINLALWGALYVRVDGLPLRIWCMAKKERVDGDARAMTALQEATAGKVGAIVNSLRTYQEDIVASFRAQVAEAEMRARVAERRSSEAGVVLSAASALVCELRGLLDAGRALSAEDVPSAAGGDELGDGEETRVGKRPCIPPPSNGNADHADGHGGAS